MFAVKTNHSNELDSFIFKTHERLSNPSNITLMVQGGCYSVRIGVDCFVVCDVKILMPPVQYIFYVGSVFLAFFGSLWALVPLMLGFVVSFFQSAFFLKVMFMSGLKKAGHSFKVVS